MRYFIGFLITLGLIIILIVILFGGGGGNKAKIPTTARALASYATTDSDVRMTIDGPVNADQSHRQQRIIINRNTVTFQGITGYDGHVAHESHYNNSQSAYTTYLLALFHAGFTKGNTDPAGKDERGFCPQSNRYIFELRENGKNVERFWTTDCQKPKTYLGNFNLTLGLFQAQVPDYATKNIENSLTAQ